jgi:hypothetical protein
MPEMIAEGTSVADLERQLEEMRKSRDYHMEQTRLARGLLADAAEARDKALADGARWLAERDAARANVETMKRLLDEAKGREERLQTDYIQQGARLTLLEADADVERVFTSDSER